MIAALLYLQGHTFRNRLVSRFKRLKQPKYLVGAVVGGLYFYFYFVRYLFQLPGRRPAAGLAVSPGHLLLLELLGAFALFVVVLLAWLVPRERGALTFTEAEVAFLFPAPITRRNLIHYKLARSQLRIFFGTLLLTLISRRFGGNLWIHALGWWLILSTLNLHLLGASFARTLLLDRGISNRLRRLLVLGVAGVAAAGIWVWARRTIPAWNPAYLADVDSAADYLQRLLTAGPALYLLYPFRLVVRPFLAPDAPAFLAALAPALLLFLLHYLWVIYSDVAFEEASLDASQKLAARIAAARAGNWPQAKANQKARRPWFKLAAGGPPATAFLWKNLIGVGQVFSSRLGVSVLVVVVVLGVLLRNDAHSQGLSIFAAIFIAITLGYSLLLGPQVLRLDFRHDLPLADVLKTFPLRGWQIALGEILAPAVALAALQWALLLVEGAIAFYLPVPHQSLLFAAVLGAAAVLPILDLLLLLIPNAAVLLFPSWTQTGKDGPRGVEAVGQRLVFALGQVLVLALALAPAALASAGAFFLLRLALGPAAAVLLAALAAAVIVAVETVLGVMLLGKWFERFDVTEDTN
ncbi:MAG: hypothetical protein KGJ60_15330 [Verrucomicrobiota bacterium]|nr:hypothetical protein [Verrucomicrobiota bacterium]